MRQFIFWMHLGAGVLISTLILFFSITGALLGYERQIVHAADERSYQAVPFQQNAPRIPLNTLIARTEAAAAAHVETVTVYSDLGRPIEIQTTSRTVFFADPYSGKVEGPISPRLRAFFAGVTALHRWFGLSGAERPTATAVKGAVALLLLFMLVSGALLWMPACWTRSSLYVGTVPRFDTHGRARNYSWHKVTGFWIALPLAIIAITGMIMAYPWANGLLFHLAGSPLPVRPTAEANQRRHAVAPPAHLDDVFAQATSEVKGWQSASLRLASGASQLAITVDRSDGGHPEKREQVLVDARTLQVVRREPFAALSRGQQWRSWVRFVHTGEAGGWWGETLAIITSSGAVVLSLTGIALFLDRLYRWRRCFADGPRSSAE